jgi:hypothetical protein
MSAFSTAVLALGESVLAYWPLEAGSGADSGPNANKEALTIVGSPAEGLPIVVGGGNSVVFDGVNVGASAAVPASGAGSQLNLTTAFSFFGWVAPSVLPQPSNVTLFGREGNQWNIGMGKTLGTPLWNLTGTGIINLQTSDENLTPCVQAGGKWTGPWPYFLCMTWDGVEFVTYINGRFSRQAIASPTFAKETKQFVLSPTGARFQGNMGHVGVINGALPAGVVRSLFQAGYLGVPPAFNDVFSLTADGIPALASITPRNLSTATVPGYPVVPIIGAAVQQSSKKAPIVGYCAGCGGAVRSNEHYVTRTFTPGGSQPIHRTCYRVRGMNSPQPTAPSTMAEIIKSASRLLMDMTLSATVKTTDSKVRYLRMNEGPLLNGTSAGSFRLVGANQENFTTISGIAPAMATLQRYYDLPRDSWCRVIAELQIDQAIAQRQWPLHTIMNGFKDAFGTMVDDLTAPPTSLGLTGGNSEYFFIEFGKTLLLLWPWLSVSKRQTWKTALINLADYQVGTYYHAGASVGPEAYYYINANRNLMSLFGIWLTWLATGEQRWKEHYELILKFIVEPEAFAPGQKLPAGYAALNPNLVGAFTNAAGGGGSEHVYGQVLTTPGTLPDGSDSVGYLGESTNSGSIAPNGLIGPGYDGDYSQLQLAICHNLYLWSGDPRILKLTNMLWNQLAPFIDKIGGKIAYRKPAIGSALGPTTVLAGGSELAAGATVIPCNLTGGMAFVAGKPLQIGEGAGMEELTIESVTLGEPGSLKVTAPTTKGHAVGALVAETTANNTFFGPWTLDAQRGSRHNAIIIFNNTWNITASWRGLKTASPPTAEDVKAQWAAIDAYFRVQYEGAAQLNAAQFREMSDRIGALLWSDPGFQMPMTPGV